MHEEQCMPVISHFRSEGRLVNVPANGTPQEIHEVLKEFFTNLLKQEEENKEEEKPSIFRKLTFSNKNK